MNIGIIIICGASIIWALAVLNGLRKLTTRPKWVIKEHVWLACFAITWALLSVIEEIWSASLSESALSYLKLYDSVIFGLCGGILLTLWLSGQLIHRSEEKNQREIMQ